MKTGLSFVLTPTERAALLELLFREMMTDLNKEKLDDHFYRSGFSNFDGTNQVKPRNLLRDILPGQLFSIFCTPVNDTPNENTMLLVPVQCDGRRFELPDRTLTGNELYHIFSISSDDILYEILPDGIRNIEKNDSSFYRPSAEQRYTTNPKSECKQQKLETRIRVTCNERSWLLPCAEMTGRDLYTEFKVKFSETLYRVCTNWQRGEQLFTREWEPIENSEKVILIHSHDEFKIWKKL